MDCGSSSVEPRLLFQKHELAERIINNRGKRRKNLYFRQILLCYNYEDKRRLRIQGKSEVRLTNPVVQCVQIVHPNYDFGTPLIHGKETIRMA